jgi:hypothetical protein
MSIIVEQQIKEEFYFMRSYISHTLCKNRYFLYLKAPQHDVVMQAFSDPSVWPLLKSEIESMFKLGQSLYGINCPAVFKDDRKKVDNLIGAIEATVRNDKVDWQALKTRSEQLSNILACIPERFTHEDFKFDLDRVKNYLNGKTADKLESEISAVIAGKLRPLIAWDNDRLTISEEDMRRYWGLYQAVMTAIRECIIAAILEGKNESFVRRIKALMHAVISCDLKTLYYLNTEP